MFEGEKTTIFWIGLIVLALASVGLFGILLMFTVWNGYGDRFNMIKYYVPFIVGGFVFAFIGFYMIKSGVKKQSGTLQLRNEKFK